MLLGVLIERLDEIRLTVLGIKEHDGPNYALAPVVVGHSDRKFGLRFQNLDEFVLFLLNCQLFRLYQLQYFLLRFGSLSLRHLFLSFLFLMSFLRFRQIKLNILDLLLNGKFLYHTLVV